MRNLLIVFVPWNFQDQSVNKYSETRFYLPSNTVLLCTPSTCLFSLEILYDLPDQRKWVGILLYPLLPPFFGIYLWVSLERFLICLFNSLLSLISSFIKREKRYEDIPLFTILWDYLLQVGMNPMVATVQLQDPCSYCPLHHIFQLTYPLADMISFLPEIGGHNC